MRAVVVSVAFVASALSVAGCTSAQVGPIRPITIADDVAYTRPLAEPDLSTFYGASPATQAAVRNQILTARMYIADVNYHYYEARLTREVQEEGLGATLATLGLTTASTLVGSAGTKTILSGAATAVVGADKAYNEKQLLSNTIQALQSQMRADRKTQAAVIYAKMFKEVGNNTKTVTPIVEYTLPMALSDADNYYQAGTIASALIGLSKTLANAEQNADQAKSQAGPNPGAVSDAKITASPIAEPLMPQTGGGPVVVGGGSAGNAGGGRGGSSVGNRGNGQSGSDQRGGSQTITDPRQACDQLSNNATATQERICANIRNGNANVQSAFQGMLAGNPAIANRLPPSPTLAAIIFGKGQNFEDARKEMLKDPVMR